MASPNIKAVVLITGDNNIKGSLQFIQDSKGITHINGKITGLTPGLHGFHIHALGDTTNGCNSTGLSLSMSLSLIQINQTLSF
ncbi:hypothetical protein MKW92_033281 [Papaver armeniacum]|nr:hypothetical protein MKW92_033281 [Papaver armeniacum]